ncbi:hypothetical protein ACMT4L_16840 [Deinococcus sp. A31D244]|uniref:hypothetical protein n=1 Tax=Deinococcus sp. A31D244 TaxID=3397675 RepID=UPI0039E10B50
MTQTETLTAAITTTTPAQLRRLTRECPGFLWIHMNDEGDALPVPNPEAAIDTVCVQYGWTRQETLDALDDAQIMVSRLGACALLAYGDMRAAGIPQDTAQQITSNLYQNLSAVEEPQAEEGGLGAIALYDVHGDGTITLIDPEGNEA